MLLKTLLLCEINLSELLVVFFLTASQDAGWSHWLGLSRCQADLKKIFIRKLHWPESIARKQKASRNYEQLLTFKKIKQLCHLLRSAFLLFLFKQPSILLCVCVSCCGMAYKQLCDKKFLFRSKWERSVHAVAMSSIHVVHRHHDLKKRRDKKSK